MVYEALVGLIRPGVAKCLMPRDVALWPRETDEPKRWEEFQERLLFQRAHRYVVQADVAGFYESIGHEQLEDDVVQLPERTSARLFEAFSHE